MDALKNKIDIIRIWAKDDFNVVNNLPPKSSQKKNFIKYWKTRGENFK